MAAQVLPQEVADAFVEQYYTIMNKCPRNLHKFYQESSLLGWPGADGVVAPVTTLSEISEKIMSSNFKDWSVEIKTSDAQKSIEGAVLVVVTGCVSGEDVKKNFSHTFFLAKQEKGFYVLNDVLRFFDVFESINEVVANVDSIDGQVAAAPTENSVSCNISDNPTSSQAKEVLEQENLDEKHKTSVTKETVAKAPAPKPHVAYPEKVHSAVIPASKTKEVSQKVSYASMVVKVSPQNSPKSAPVSSNAGNQAIAPPTAKPSSPDGAPKVSSPNTAAPPKALALQSNVAPNTDASKPSAPPSNVAPNAAGPKPSAPQSNVAPKVPTGSNGPQNARAYTEARGIYIGGLPYDITKQGVLEVIKKFGQVRRSSDSIQIRRHEDGFCCGFVEFESPDSARRAVEAHHVKFGEMEAYMTYKRSGYRGIDGGRGRSPSRSGARGGNYRGQDNGEVGNERKFQNERRSAYGKGQVRGSRRSRPSDQWTSDEGEDAQGWSN